MAELEVLDLAEVVAVDLVRERPVAVDGQLVDVGAQVERGGGASGRGRCRAHADAAPTNVGSDSERSVSIDRPRSSVASGVRSNGRLPRYVYGLVFSRS